jgi:hypothetical protein
LQYGAERASITRTNMNPWKVWCQISGGYVSLIRVYKKPSRHFLGGRWMEQNYSLNRFTNTWLFVFLLANIIIQVSSFLHKWIIAHFPRCLCDRWVYLYKQNPHLRGEHKSFAVNTWLWMMLAVIKRRIFTIEYLIPIACAPHGVQVLVPPVSRSHSHGDIQARLFEGGLFLIPERRWKNAQIACWESWLYAQDYKTYLSV